MPAKAVACHTQQNDKLVMPAKAVACHTQQNDKLVMPAKAGIQLKNTFLNTCILDASLRWHDSCDLR